MSTYYETGHVKNVANFLKYNQFLTTLGATYNPSNTNITVASLTTTQATAKIKQDAVNAAEGNWKDASNNRETAFKPLANFSTQLLGALKSTNATQQTIDDFVFLVGKMRGDSNAKLTKADAGITVNPTSNPTTEPVTTTKSTSQQSFDQKIEHFDKMILKLQTVPSYTPNETNFQIITLQAQLVTLKSLNATAELAKSNLKAARIDRNLFFYAVDTGFLDTIKKSKSYIKGVYGATSQQYKTALTFKFVRVISKKKSN